MRSAPTMQNMNMYIFHVFCIYIFWIFFKHVKACPHISKYIRANIISAFIQSGYKESFIFS